jgi:hypothetical protein
MSSKTQNSSVNPEDNKDKEQSDRESPLKNMVDVDDLVMKGRSSLDPTEIGSNPALAPETVTLDDPAEIREGFRFDRDRE